MRTLPLVAGAYQEVIMDANNIYYHLPGTYYVLNSKPHTFQMLPHFTLTITLLPFPILQARS